MSEPGSRRGRGRTHDAEGAREAILNAAEEVFAEHGFDGARIDAIAEASGYNKSLIFHYYDDKLGLYAAVLRRIDEQGTELQAQLLAPLLEDESLTSDADKFKTFLETATGLLYDVLVEHPRLLRMIAWEEAEGWQTMKKIASQFVSEDEKRFRQLLNQAQQAGLIRPKIDTDKLFYLIYGLCQSYLNSIPLMEMSLEGENLSSPDALKRAREMIIDFVIHGIMADP